MGKHALASNTIRRGATTTGTDPAKRATEKKFRDLQRRWPDLPGEADKKLAARYKKAVDGLAETLG